MKINVASGVVAFSALPITIDVTAEETVVLRGITLKSLTPGSGNGISVLAGDLIVEGSEVDGWNTGLYVRPRRVCPSPIPRFATTSHP